MRERALRFGAEGHLVGVLAEPDAGCAPGSAAVVFTNVGLGHRMGPHRFYVDAARRLAERGVPSLRFNVSGLGDSATRSETSTTAERGRKDLLDAMGLLEARRGIARFSLVALCAAVDAQHPVALEDPRVQAAAFLDGYCYVTPGYQLRRMLRSVRSPDRLAGWARRMLERSPAEEELPEGGDVAGFFERAYPTRERFRADVLAMRARGVRLYFHYSMDWYHVNHARQLAEVLEVDALPDGISVEYGLTDHMLTGADAREALTARLVDWLAAPACAAEPEEAGPPACAARVREAIS